MLGPAPDHLEEDAGHAIRPGRRIPASERPAEALEEPAGSDALAHRGEDRAPGPPGQQDRAAGRGAGAAMLVAVQMERHDPVAPDDADQTVGRSFTGMKLEPDRAIRVAELLSPSPQELHPGDRVDRPSRLLVKIPRADVPVAQMGRDDEQPLPSAERGVEMLLAPPLDRERSPPEHRQRFVYEQEMMAKRRDGPDSSGRTGCDGRSAGVVAPSAHPGRREDCENGRGKPSRPARRPGRNGCDQAGDGQGAHEAILAARERNAKLLLRPKGHQRPAGDEWTPLGPGPSRGPASLPADSFDPDAPGPDDGRMRRRVGWLLPILLTTLPVLGQEPYQPAQSPPEASSGWIPSPGPWRVAEEANLVSPSGAVWQIVISERRLGTIPAGRSETPLLFPRVAFRRILSSDTVTAAIMLPTGNRGVGFFPEGSPEEEHVPQDRLR